MDWVKVVDLDTGSSSGQSAAYGVYGGKLYFTMDFFPGHEWRVWDPASPSSYTTLATFPGAAESAGGGCWGPDGLFYFCGGLQGIADQKELWTYDPGSDTWTQKTDAPWTMLYANMAPWGSDTIYAFGSNDTPGASYKRVMKYSISGDSWTDLGNKFSNQRGDGICCVPDVTLGKIVCFGGFNSGLPTSGLQSFHWDPVSDTKTDMTDLPVQFSNNNIGNVTGMFADGTIPLYRGSLGANDGTWLYDPGLDAWTQIINAGDFPDFDSDVYNFWMPGGIIDNVWYVLGFASIWKLGTAVATPSSREGWGVLM